MITLEFDGVTLSCWQIGKLNQTIQFKKTELMSGKTHVALGTVTTSFPMDFQCYALTDFDLISVFGKMLVFGTLIVDEVEYPDCFICVLNNIHEEIMGAGIWTYNIQFDHADVMG